MSDEPGAIARPAALTASLLVAASCLVTGHAGGELVYRHGAAGAYLEPERVSAEPVAAARRTDAERG